VPLDQSTSEQQGVTVVALAGQLDSRTAPDFEKALLKLVAGGKREILLDLAQLEYVASAGLRIFVMVGKRLQADGGRLALCALNESVLKVLEISGFVPLFPIRPDRKEAIPWLLSNARVARVSNLAGEILRRETTANPRHAPLAAADHEKTAYAAELLRKKDPPAGKKS
jgi:anti-anti-sigma factor